MISVESMVKSVAETVGSMFGSLPGEIPHGHFVRPLIDLKLQTSGSRWGLPTVVENYRGINYLGLPTTSPKSREWLQVPRGHSRSRRGNRR